VDTGMSCKKLYNTTVRVAVFILLGGMILSRPLWDVAARDTFPLVPIWGEAYRASGGLYAWGVALLLLSGCGAFVFPARKWIVLSLLLCLAAFCMQDVNRLQPWVWFSALLLGVALFSRTERDAEQAVLLLLAGVYVWGGFHKTTPYFAEDNFAWFCGVFDFTAPLGRYPSAGYALAAFELLLGPGLLYRKTRRFAAVSACVFHLFIAVALSPYGLDWNAVVIPWNAGMAFLLALFFKKQTDEKTNAFPRRLLDIRQPAIVALFVAVWLAPALSLAGFWPDALSWNLYTNTQAEVTFYSKSIYCDSKLETFRKENSFDGDKMLLDDWANSELKIPLFSDTRVFRQLGRYLCRCAESPDSAGLYILRVRPWDKNAETLEKIPCARLIPLR
jgi:hypothetical protein